MIRYSLSCDNRHSFDSWFRNSEAFDTLAQSGSVNCPHCGSTTISKSLMTPRLGKEAQAEPQHTPDGDSEQARAVVPHPEKLRALLRNLRRKVEESCDYVGDDFAEEARRIYYGETEARGIYGETTPEDAEALVEEGVDFARIPWLPRDDA